MKQLHVGDEWVTVAPGYVVAEREYMEDLMTEWEVQVFNDAVDEELRQKILDKRVEFYNLYKEGKITITRPPQLTWWKKIWREIRNVPEPENRYFRRVD